MTIPHNSALQSFQGHLQAQTPSGLPCHLQGHRAPTTEGDKHFCESSGIQHRSLNTPRSWGRFGLAVTDLFHILQWPTVRFYLVQPMLSHLLEKDNNRPGKHTDFSLQNQQTCKWILFSQGPNLCPQHRLLCSSLLSLSSALQSALGQISCPWQTPNLPQRQGIFDFTATALLPLTLNLL